MIRQGAARRNRPFGPARPASLAGSGGRGGRLVRAGQELAGDVGAKLAFKIKDPDAAFTVDLSKAPGAVASGAQPDATATLTLSDEDLGALVADVSQARALFQQGKLRIDGDMKVAHRLGFLKNLG